MSTTVVVGVNEESVATIHFFPNHTTILRIYRRRRGRRVIDTKMTSSSYDINSSSMNNNDQKNSTFTSPSLSFWAYGSHDNELDPQLKAAQRQALKEQTMKEGEKEDDMKEPLILRNLLTTEQIEEILAKASQDGVWPRGLDHQVQTSKKSCVALHSVPHHFAWTQEHVVLYMHNNDWFVESLPAMWCVIRGAMEARPWMNGGIPVLDEAFCTSEHSMKHVRSIELHHYATGGHLLTPGHRDCGSDLTISVLLSDTANYTGGDFVTYRQGTPVAHKMKRGDAILFRSEDLHNISTVTSGVRQSLVVELYPP